MAAKECIHENAILRQIAPEAIEQNDGLFVALDDSDMDFRTAFLERCRECEIPTEEFTPAKALLAIGLPIVLVTSLVQKRLTRWVIRLGAVLSSRRA